MESRDIILRGSFKDIDVRFTLAETTDTVTRGIIIHNTDPVASHIFGSALTTASMLSPLLTENEKYSIRWTYDGLIENIIVDVDAETNLRGIPKNTSLIQADSKGQLYGEDGHISLIKAANGKILSSGTSQAALLDVTDDVSFFFSTSDQIETEGICALNFRANPEDPVEIAAGFMMQALPGCDLEMFEPMREAIKDEAFIKILTGPAHDEKKLQQALKYVYAKTGKESPEDIRDVASYEFGATPKYHCNCSKEKMKRALMTLPANELKNMLKQPGGIKIECDFCRSSYVINSL